MAMKPKAVKIRQKPGKGGAGNEEIGPGGKGRPPAKRSKKP
jgi:hypothetical protein